MGDILAGLIDVERGDVTLTRQLYDQLRATMLSGAWPPGHRLPSSRELARQLGLSRNTVSGVIDQLAMEGYLDVAQGRRPTVTATNASKLVGGRTIARQSAKPLHASRWGERLRIADWPFREGPPRPLAPAHADARAFPHDIWARCLRRAARHAPHGTAGVNRASLRSALLRHLVEHRGVRADSSQIIILPSAQSAVELTARLVLNAGEIAWVESPGYGGARAAMQSAGADVRGVKLDRGGLDWKGRRDRPRLIFVTPSHQHPTGRLMPINRRRELLRFANEAGAAVIEDDYDSEIHYDGRPIASLQGLDDSGRVIYIGTFSKSTFADIRCGYAIVPPDLVDVFETAQRHSGQIMPAPVQDALAEFIDDGHFAAHIRKMTRIYRARRDRLIATLTAVAGAHLTLEPPAGGVQLLAHLDSRCDDRAIATRLAAAGVTARPLSPHFTGEVGGRGLYLGFAAWNEAEIDIAAATIGRVLGEMIAPPRKRRSKAPAKRTPPPTP
ncbi:PLP-dependent aminotransferase family protein [Tardiphaga sp. vice352]|uniref:MocR-like pyridoxine biosynthesis transcription factor PdxR n=1 Tax=Tardiphaga sp. vice352 TaxID=2592816 RepID=UPI001165B1C3|nr:PLP-dependent aminotransferase family protein [Tardiphaga sp. vice352]QDM31804.1 PLP-dependent aminotransferase family protein [Tardiphaga sp. vice352]